VLGGESTAAGTVLYDTDKAAENAVFCRFEEGKPVIESGKKADLINRMKAFDEKPKEKDTFFKMLGIEILVFIVIIVIVLVFIGGFFPVFGAVLFMLLGWFPCLVLIYGRKKLYKNPKDFEVFRSFHGAEHMAVKYMAKNPKEQDFCEYSKLSPFHRECGTVYAASFLILSGITGILFGFIPEIGFFRFLGGILLSALLLFFNLFNPYNPLMIFQRAVVKKPDEETALLVFRGIQKLTAEQNKE